MAGWSIDQRRSIEPRRLFCEMSSVTCLGGAVFGAGVIARAADVEERERRGAAGLGAAEERGDPTVKLLRDTAQT